MVRERNLFRARPFPVARELVEESTWEIEDLSALVSDIDFDRKGVPISLKQYLKPGGELVAFNVDRSLANALDGLIVDEGATMAEIAARSGTKIGSLYRFFPNKESIADTIVVNARENLDAVFDRFDAAVNALSIRAPADDLMALIFELFTKPAFMKLLDAGQDWSVKPPLRCFAAKQALCASDAANEYRPEPVSDASRRRAWSS